MMLAQTGTASHGEIDDVEEEEVRGTMTCQFQAAAAEEEARGTRTCVGSNGASICCRACTSIGQFQAAAEEEEVRGTHAALPGPWAARRSQRYS